MEFRALIQKAIEIRKPYAELEKKDYGRSWAKEEIAMGFVGDVGDLAKLIMAESGIRHIPDAKEKLSHELSDCLWFVLVLAHLYEIDLEIAFFQTMEEFEQQMALSKE